MIIMIMIKCDSEKNELDFSEPIIVDIVTKKEMKIKLDVPVGTEVANSCL